MPLLQQIAGSCSYLFWSTDGAVVLQWPLLVHGFKKSVDGELKHHLMSLHTIAHLHVKAVYLCK